MRDIKMRRKLCWDEQAALEGLPLYLIILVVIAAIAIVVIFGYLTALQTPELARIDVYIDGERADTLETTEGTHDIYVVAIADDGSKLDDVTVTLTGAGVNTAKKTDSDGKADFGEVELAIVTGTYDEVRIDATYDGGNVNTPVSESLLVNGN